MALPTVPSTTVSPGVAVDKCADICARLGSCRKNEWIIRDRERVQYIYLHSFGDKGDLFLYGHLGEERSVPLAEVPVLSIHIKWYDYFALCEM